LQEHNEKIAIAVDYKGIQPTINNKQLSLG